jgi:GNAT superfamily N-acetyltransferase
VKEPAETNTTIRTAAMGDLSELIELCAAHAAFERASFSSIGLQERLSAALFDQAPRAIVFVVDFNHKLVGYASCSKEFSTWAGAEFLHMDCLFVSEGFRGQGLGRKLVEAVLDEARKQRASEVQWQTPDWNKNAIKFYSSIGAKHSMKARFKQKTAL